uniref:Uncharacterized protein n=1 Tax=Anopheles quadriannulatus TaxID=34691 RepID=A0A182X787_ANOQN
MNALLALVVLMAATVYAAPVDSDAQAQIVSQTSDVQPDGSFNYAFESANGIKVEDQGSIKSIKVPKLDETGRQIGEEDVQVSVQTGSFQYTAPDGQVYTLRYIADENGFQPQADHLPIVLALVASAYAYPQHEHHERHEHHETTTYIPILKYDKQQGEDGSYRTIYQTGNNIVHEESGYLKDASEDHPNGILVQQGAYSYEAPNGDVIQVQYTADENGFRVQSDSLPTPPPVPPAIQEGLKEIYEGIKRREQEAKNNPKYAEDEARRAQLDYNGQYYNQ